MIGKGYSVSAAMTELKMVAEGYYATQSAYKLNQKLKAHAPIIEAVYAVLYEGEKPDKVFKQLSNELD